ncbi:pyridoxamine 5'-phosphate oxidase family protein [Mycobacterium gastri]|uniref:pyridoxamine 5'-phosphate oxidase family protein n=1 Tax=Mycobacterium gastri TaxID=1777 RepID=UPI0003E5AB72|nr:pyridoxamine 5'-phosphate oxidase family protein [Mycobacterium gastri]ETW22287.1 hypothetical protein MGAST_20995 [Mycobacterium gastri 'Wayne']
MIKQEIDAELGTAGAQELLASTSAAHLAYVGKDGTPRVIPVGYFWTGEEFVIATATTSPKVAALSGSANVALSIDSGDTPETARALSNRSLSNLNIRDSAKSEEPRTRCASASPETSYSLDWLYDNG